jgi:hypothetical protein
MAEPEIFSVGVSTIANIGVAIGTGILAYFTYKSVKASETQVEISKKMVDGPLILENIQTIINPLQSELKNEIEAIESKELAWIIPNEDGNLYSRPLIFPISKLKFFYENFLDLFYTPGLRRDSRLQVLIDAIGSGIQERIVIFKKIDEVLYRFADDLDQSHFDKRVDDLLDSTDFKIIIQLPESTGLPEDLGRVSRSVLESNTITKTKAGNIIKSLIISTLFKPLEKNDLRLVWTGDFGLTTKLYGKISQHLINDPVPHSAEIKRSIESDLASLESLDKRILVSITMLKVIYQEIYSFKGSNLNTPQGIK